MEDFLGPLFAKRSPAPDATAEPAGQAAPAEHTFAVAELNEAIAAALERSFPTEIWLRGEIQGLARNRGRKHVYFELVEKEEGRDQPKSSIAVALLQWNRAGVERDLARAPGFALDDGLEVRIRCRVSYYAPWGKLQLTMVGVDPEFTLGKLAQNRERILRALSAEGLLERNGLLPLPLVPLRIGLVTSLGSAAYNDFVQELRRGGYAFAITAVDVRVQGPQAEGQIVAALHRLARRDLDLVALIRGGGSRSDLAAFDGEAMARAIAQCPLPVWTGIGHEIDSSVADAVAHRNFKTPTACAAALVQCVEAFAQRTQTLWVDIVQAARGQTLRDRTQLQRASRELGRRLRTMLNAQAQNLRQARRRARRAAQRSVERSRSELDRTLGRLSELARLRSQREAEQLQRLGARLPQSRRRALEAGHQLDALEARVRALDPRRVMARGYTLTRESSGALVRSARQLAPGMSVRTEFVDGQVESRVEAIQVDTKERA